MTIEDGRVVAIDSFGGRPAYPILAPGYVDLQVNGIGDLDVASADDEQWETLGARLSRAGVTAWCPTLVTRPLDGYRAPLARIAGAMATTPPGSPAILGCHLEGPFLGVAGAHDAALLRDPDLDWLAELPSVVRLITLAPEHPHGLDAVELLTGRGVVVAVGHSAASFETATAAFDAGARLLTHAGNASGPYHHRAPGVIAAALRHHRAAMSLIADGRHLHPATLALLARLAGPRRTVLVSDTVAGDTSAPDGTLRGSSALLDEAVRTAVRAGVPVADALRAASATPAGVLGARHIGRLEAGARADLVALDDDLRVLRTWVSGR